MTLPLSRQAILTGMLITVLPMMGDYFTNQLLSGAQSTSMIGNVIDSQLNNSTQEAQGAALSILLLAFLLAPMLYYVRKTREGLGGGILMTLTATHRPAGRRRRGRSPGRDTADPAATAPRVSRRRPPWRNPWRRPWLLEASPGPT